MSAVATAPRERTRRASHSTLRAEIRHAWETQVDDRRSMRRDQLDGLEPFARYVMHLCRRPDGRDIIKHPDGSVTIFRTIPQMARGVDGWTHTTAKDDHRRYYVRVRRYSDYLTRIGWMDGKQPIYKPNGEGLGILLRVTPAGVAQSVRAAES